MREKVTILTPLFLTGHKLKIYEKSIRSFYESLEKPYPHHIIKDDSSQENHLKVKKLIEELNPNHTFLDRENKTNGFHTIVKLIDEVKTKYFFFIIDDAAMTMKKDFIKPIIMHMEKDNKTIQVKIGGGGVCSGKRPSNTNNIILNKDGTVSLRVNKKVKWHPNKYRNDTIWVMDLKSENTEGEMPITYWNCIHRTDIFKKINDLIKIKKSRTHSKSWAHYQCYTNYVGAKNSIIKTKGWPKDFKFLNDYKTGWLNMCCYIYPFQRNKIPYDTFKESHTVEIK